jgi:hypothetical protein
MRRFNPKWFNEFGNWLEYSIVKDAAFCLCCYLFSPTLESKREVTLLLLEDSKLGIKRIGYWFMLEILTVKGGHGSGGSGLG